MTPTQRGDEITSVFINEKAPDFRSGLFWVLGS